MPRSQTRSRSDSPWKRRTRHARDWDLLFIVVALATAGGFGYALLRLLGNT